MWILVVVKKDGKKSLDAPSHSWPSPHSQTSSGLASTMYSDLWNHTRPPQVQHLSFCISHNFISNLTKRTYNKWISREIISPKGKRGRRRKEGLLFHTNMTVQLSTGHLSSLQKLWLHNCSRTTREGCESHRDGIRCAGSLLLGSHKLHWLLSSVPF